MRWNIRLLKSLWIIAACSIMLTFSIFCVWTGWHFLFSSSAIATLNSWAGCTGLTNENAEYWWSQHCIGMSLFWEFQNLNSVYHAKGGTILYYEDNGYLQLPPHPWKYLTPAETKKWEISPSCRLPPSFWGTFSKCSLTPGASAQGMESLTFFSWPLLNSFFQSGCRALTRTLEHVEDCTSLCIII